ncbi:MAG: hypothetical protein AVDCRST_MAG29-2466 [uncultured Nocardioidaceae bacterium]|uniref:Uncharacterized protein n=1 Tax=uncultured Nocardioidaceae bacterium TaxID=253824 RepID=A0A6J4M9Q6_9ACTN|nr:MAG: hypothetical protein AVDCRST_MAG29-2466 [uncultured Nocardioidaceae bacterium]
MAPASASHESGPVGYGACMRSRPCPPPGVPTPDPGQLPAAASWSGARGRHRPTLGPYCGRAGRPQLPARPCAAGSVPRA